MPFDFAKLKESFFDSAKVMAKVNAGKRKVLSKMGAFVRTRARSSMRKRKRSAAAGAPPSVHAGQLKNLLFFSWDDRTESVVIGTVPLSGDAVVPGLMERGGELTIPAIAPGGKRATASQAAAFKRMIASGAIARPERTARKTVKYQAHPFMQPALEAERPRFAEQLKGLIA